ncbi:MAG TPA: baseplate J/gp47 family protein [Gammaproteobacteria bacterium]|nr:baseplate J/gp47 family protein [Gammaproteobacteria bacterium]
MSGITSQGFDRPSFAEIREALATEARNVLGPVNTGPESAIGQQISIQAEREALIWEALEAIYLSQYPDSAAGRSLDGAVQLTGITRLPATKTVVEVTLAGDPDTVIPAGSQASTDDGDVFELTAEVTLDANGDGTGNMQALEAGEVLALAGTLTNIETPVSGWDSVTNPDDGDTGRDEESDSELRQRRQESLQITGAGTVEAIRARMLQQVDDVSAVTIIENRTDTTDAEGRPPHSFETVVSGGIDDDVADLLWEVKPAGIETHGDISVIVTDSQGEPQTIEFSRPVDVYIWADITVDVADSDEFPDGAETTIKEEIVASAEARFGVGDDVIYQALFGPIYNNVPGIGDVTITVASSSDAGTQPDPGDYASANIALASNEISRWLEDRIAVTINV